MGHVCNEYWECDRCGTRVEDQDKIRDWLDEHYTGSLLCMPCGGQLKARVRDFCTLADLQVQGKDDAD